MVDAIEKEASELVDKMPEPQEHAIRAEEQARPATFSIVDRLGRPFDPAVHVTKPDGTPEVNVDGTIRQKRGRGARRPESRMGVPARPLSSPQAAGTAIAEGIFSIGQLVGGEEWRPVLSAEHGIDERGSMRDAWVAYCEQKEITDVPPGVAVSLCVIGYIIPRFAMPKTKTRFETAKEWVGGKLGAWRGRKAGRNAARSDNGSN